MAQFNPMGFFYLFHINKYLHKQTLQLALIFSYSNLGKLRLSRDPMVFNHKGSFIMREVLMFKSLLKVSGGDPIR
jgi:hypothetical protein